MLPPIRKAFFLPTFCYDQAKQKKGGPPMNEKKVSLRIPEDLWSSIEDLRFSLRFSYQQDAILMILQKGIDAIAEETRLKNDRL